MLKDEDVDFDKRDHKGKCVEFDDFPKNCEAVCKLNGDVAEIDLIYMTPKNNDFTNPGCVALAARLLHALLHHYKDKVNITQGVVRLQTLKTTALKALNCYRKAFILNGFDDLSESELNKFNVEYAKDHPKIKGAYEKDDAIFDLKIVDVELRFDKPVRVAV